MAIVYYVTSPYTIIQLQTSLIVLFIIIYWTDFQLKISLIFKDKINGHTDKQVFSSWESKAADRSQQKLEPNRGSYLLFCCSLIWRNLRALFSQWNRLKLLSSILLWLLKYFNLYSPLARFCPESSKSWCIHRPFCFTPLSNSNLPESLQHIPHHSYCNIIMYQHIKE